MLQKFLRAIEETKTIEPNDRLVVGVSGGPDSMCLLALLLKIRRRFGLSICVAHVDHGLRGEEAAQDADLVRNICREKSIPFYLHQANITKYAASHKIGVEEAGRRVRYAFFREVMQRERADKIVTAHHMEDQAETVLMHILRGTSVEGLVGIQEKRGDHVVRPLLRFTKQELIAYLKDEKIPYRVDKSNLDDSYTRNLIRNQLIQQLKAVNPDVCGALYRLSTFAKTDSDFIKSFADKAWRDYVTAVDEKTVLINRELFDNYPPAVADRVLYWAIQSAASDESWGGRDFRGVYALIRKGKNGQEISVIQNVFVALEYRHVCVFHKTPGRAYSYHIPVGTGMKIQEAGMVFYAYYERQSEVKPAKNQIVFALPPGISTYTIRSRKTGDQYMPRGFDGHRKLKELFIDLKIPKRLRGKIPLLEIDGEILWVFGARESGLYPVPEQKAAEHVFVFEYQFMENGTDLQLLQQEAEAGRAGQSEFS